MQLFKNFRQAVIDNDTAAILELADGDLLTDLQNNGTISAKMRRDVLFIEAAYEEVDVRLTDPAKAWVCAFVKENGKLMRFDISMENNKNNVRKIISLKKTPHTPEPAFKRFLNACNKRQKQLYTAALAQDLQKKNPEIPQAMQIENEITFRPVRITGDDAVFSVDADGIRGNIRMKRDGFFWRVSAIDNILDAVPPAVVAAKFCGLFPDALQNPDAMKEFVSEKAIAKITKADPADADLLKRLAAFKQVTGQKASGKGVTVNCLIDSETETGTISFKCVFEGDRWMISDGDLKTLVYAKDASPSAIVQKFAAAWEKGADAGQIKELTLPAFAASLTKKEPENELAVEVQDEKVDGSRATVTAVFSNCKQPGKKEYTLILNSGKWQISGAKDITEAAADSDSKTEEKAG
ncbi:MAG: hypothetical protein IKC82_06885 [Lentisphaeria bacterium]|nr:hypothetical protein [Lentisphaeria bacterium]